MTRDRIRTRRPSPRRFGPILALAVALVGASTAAFAAPRSSSDSPPPATQAAQPTGAELGARLAALGRLRALGDDYDLAVSGLFGADGPETFRAWRALADTLSEAADGLHRHRLVIVAHRPDRRASALVAAQTRAHALRDALITRGVERDRISTVVGPPTADGVQIQIRFERIEMLETSQTADPMPTVARVTR